MTERPSVPPMDEIPTGGGSASIIDDLPLGAVTDPIIPDGAASKNTAKNDKGSKGTGLGNNRTITGTVPQLKPADQEKIENAYMALAFGIRPFNQHASETVFDNRSTCAEAWMDLARENVKVRRFLLTMMEGSAWSVLISAHIPIVLACVPPNTLSRLPFMPQPREDENDA